MDALIFSLPNLEVTKALSDINGTRKRPSVFVPVPMPMKRAKSLLGTPLSKPTCNDFSEELRELRASLAQQTSTPTGVRGNLFDSPVMLTDEEAHALTSEVMAAAVCKQMSTENCIQHRGFVEGDLDPEDTDDIATLQKFYLACQLKGDTETARQVEKKILELFIMSNENLHTSFGTIIGTDETTCRWALLYSTLYCANPICHKQLPLEDTQNTHLKKLVYYELHCSHAGRFCEECVSHKDPQRKTKLVGCIMCSLVAKPSKSFVYQKTGGTGSRHTNCFNDPCEACQSL